VYRKFFVLNMAYTKSSPVTERPEYVDREVDLVHKDFDLAISNSKSFIEHGMHDIEMVVN